MKTKKEIKQRIEKLKEFQIKVRDISLVSDSDTEEFIMTIEQQIQELKWVLGKG